jgi:hypothetical protein
MLSKKVRSASDELLTLKRGKSEHQNESYP